MKSTDSAIPVFIENDILPVKSLYFYSIGQLMYDVKYNCIPSTISKLFTYTKDIHNYETRSSTNDNFYSSHSRLNTQKYSFSRVGVRLWNQIPPVIRNLSKKKFQSELKSFFLQDLTENRYDIEISDLFG